MTTPNQTHEQWSAKFEAMVARHIAEGEQLSDEREALVFPSLDLLRPATAADVRVGAVFYYPRDNDPWWCVVDEVKRPDDDFKAFVADDGCRYGLHGAFVKKEIPQ